MTVPLQTPRVTHDTDGIEDEFAFTFKVLDEDSVQVYLNDNVEPENPASYSVALSGDPLGQDGGAVTMNTPPDTGTLTILRATERVQDIDYQAFDSFPSETHERGLDKVMLLAQEQSDFADRAVVSPPGADPDVNFTLPGYDAGKAIRWSNDDPKRLENTTIDIGDFDAAVLAAEAARDKAEQWADEDEDVPVETGPDQFSAKHWATKANLSALEVGDTIQSFRSTKTGRWLLIYGQTVGSGASAADEADDTYEDLFTFLWDEFDDTICPVTGGRGASAAADWAADKIIALFDGRGRFLLGADNMGGVSADRVTDAEADALGDAAGAEDVTLTNSELSPHLHGTSAHTHTTPIADQDTGGGVIAPLFTGVTITDAANILSGDIHQIPVSSGGGANTGSTGSGNATPIMNPYITVNTFIRY